MLNKKNRTCRAFTLIEAIIVIIILGIVAGVSSPIMYSVARSIGYQESISKVRGQGQMAFNRMIREMRLIRSNDSADLTNNDNDITFTDINGNTISYSLSGTTLMRNTQALADDVTSLDFTYQNEDGSNTSKVNEIYYITVEMTIDDGTSSETLKETIFMRNLRATGV